MYQEAGVCSHQALDLALRELSKTPDPEGATNTAELLSVLDDAWYFIAYLCFSKYPAS
jgi:hypothetical protein